MDQKYVSHLQEIGIIRNYILTILGRRVVIILLNLPNPREIKLRARRWFRKIWIRRIKKRSKVN